MRNAPTLITTALHKSALHKSALHKSALHKSALHKSALHKSTMAVTELRCDQWNFGRTAHIPPEDAYLIALQLRACPDHALYFEGRFTRAENYTEGVTSIYDLRSDPVADIRDPYHCLMFYLPRMALDRIAHEAGAPRIGDLRHRRGVSVDDAVVRHLLSLLLPALRKPSEAHPLFPDHVALALTAHMACVYGGMNPNTGMPRGALRRGRNGVPSNC